MDWIPVWHYEEFQYHSSRDGGGHALGEYSYTHSWCLHQHVVLCSRAPVLPSQVYSVYYALPEEKDYDCDAFDLSVQMEKESAGRIHQESTRHECKLLCCKIRLNYDVIFLYVVSYDGASESYQITIEYMWVYINYSNFKKRFKVTHSSGAFVPLICLFWNVLKDQMIRWLFINL